MDRQANGADETPRARRDRLVGHALGYPFDPPGHSFLMHTDLTVPEAVHVSAFEMVGNDRGVAPLVGLEIESHDGEKRDYVDRVPLIAAGSNASFRRLTTKFTEAGQAADFPVLLVQVSDLVPVYSAHISKYGSIPGTLTHDAGAASLLHIAFVDPVALKRINDSEGLGFNYGLALIEQLNISLGDDRLLPGVCAYISRRGAFAPDGSPLRIDAFSVEKSGLPSASQSQVLERLRRLVAARDEMDVFVHAHIDSREQREARMKSMRERAKPVDIPNMGWIAGEKSGPRAELPDGFG